MLQYQVTTRVFGLLSGCKHRDALKDDLHSLSSRVLSTPQVRLPDGSAVRVSTGAGRRRRSGSGVCTPGKS